jgi:hypothetical protein
LPMWVHHPEALIDRPWCRRRGTMPTVALRLDPRELVNPDLDIRYALPDLLIEQSGGVLSDDGYDYVGDAPYLLVFLKTSNIEKRIAYVLNMIETCQVLDNDLKGSIVVALDEGQGYEIIYPAGFQGTFPV